MISSTLFPIYFMDAPQILDAAVTNIPGAASAPLQVVAESGFKAAYAVSYIDTTGNYIGLYTGGVGQEQLRCIIGGGAPCYTIPVVVAAHSRVSLRSMTASSLTSGMLTLTFLGQGWNGPAG